MTNDLAPAADVDPHVVTLGTAGGPRWWKGPTQGQRAGIATAVVVGDAAYLVDAGHGVGRQLMMAGIGIPSIRGVFLTHLHSDHTIDLAGVAVFGFLHITDPNQPPIRILGPGNRGALPPVSPRARRRPEPLFPENPTPGTREMVHSLMRAYSTDINDRVMDSLRPSPLAYFQAEDIEVPRSTGFHPNENPTPETEPFEVYRDELVTVTATLVKHPPIAPAFAFRFDTAEGSVTISGDTAPCDNLVRLASGTDLLLHEAIDFDWVDRAYAHEEPETAQASVDHHRKSHTGPIEAGEIATRAGAGALALHHLVPGTADPAVWRQAEKSFDRTVHVPDDLESISFARRQAPSPAAPEQA
ncbi:ribonuclease BN (tRNA processing enzyme) [Spinactinospora alkalitolerans]|uniref:Ribonuclease BN (tRNA processing enzyme) n=1 Tax=Spinactinospora alkalitolerans TaxID=687207 RepID=A0A852U237_9ACTN|nr:MBL fold metallo-hydrolase [Spinactinospora alkalitolerans]NYE50278.1 ribonuclease BN (tRNA processing enzyme) [Spinactinospora alkalitolerans]